MEEDEEGYASEDRFSATLRYPKRDMADTSFFGAEDDEDIPQHHIEQYYVGHSVDVGDQTPPTAIHGALWMTESR